MECINESNKLLNSYDEIRSLNRAKKSNPQMYWRRDFNLDIAKNVVKTKSFQLINEMNREDQLIELNDYVSNCTQSELIVFGKKFNFESFLKFIITTSDPNQRFIALQILSRVTMSGEAKFEFFVLPKLIKLCQDLIGNIKYVPYIFTILISGSEYQDFANLFLESDICDFLLTCPVNVQVAMLVSNLTWFESDYLEKLLEILLNIFKDQISKKDKKIDYSICTYAFKSIHHIFNWDNIDSSAFEEINSNFTPLFYTLAPLLFNNEKNRVFNAIFRYMNHLTDVPLEFGNLILEAIATNKIHKDKTIKLSIIPFINNAQTWAQEFNENFLAVVFTKLNDVPYEVKLVIFKAVLLYYDCVEGVIDQFMPIVVEYCLSFISDKEVTGPTLQKLIKILSSSKNNINISSTISDYMNVLEELIISDEFEDDAIAVLAEELIKLLKK